MIEPLENLPAGVIGFRAGGRVEASDYRDVLVPALEAVLREHGRINVVLVIGQDFDYSLGAILEDVRMFSIPRHAWNRMALVTDHDVLAGIATAMGGLVPGDFRVFPMRKQNEAVAWVAEGVQQPA